MRSAFGPYVELLAEEVDRLTLVAHDPPTDADHAEQLADYVAHPSRDNIEVLSLGPFGGRRDYWQRRRRIALAVGAASPSWDVLLLRFGRRAGPIFRANRCPRVVTLVWGTSMPEGVRSLLRTRDPLRVALGVRREWHLRRILGGSGLAFSDGEACVEQYGRHVPDRRMGLLRSSSRRARYSYRAEDRLDRPDPRFLVVGHVTAAKGVFDAIEAFRLVRSELMPEASLHVVGIGPALEEARRRVHEAGLADAVTFHGWVPAGDELFDLYRRSDVLLFLSRSSTESLPRVVSEAWAHSVLVVSTPAGSLPVAYEHDRELLFVPIGEPGAAADAVRRLRNDRTLRCGILGTAYRKAEETTLEHAVDHLLEATNERWPELAHFREGGGR